MTPTVSYTSAIDAYYAKRETEAKRAAGTLEKPKVDTTIREGDSEITKALKKQASVTKGAGVQQANQILDNDKVTDDDSAVTRQLKSRRKTDKARSENYFESEDYLRMAAFEIKTRITTYQNLGLTAQYQQAQQDGAAVVRKYQAILKKAAEAKATPAVINV